MGLILLVMDMHGRLFGIGGTVEDKHVTTLPI
jgi:hypothetical protein